MVVSGLIKRLVSGSMSTYSRVRHNEHDRMLILDQSSTRQERKDYYIIITDSGAKEPYICGGCQGLQGARKGLAGSNKDLPAAPGPLE